MGTSHIVWKHRLSAGKPFFPGGYKFRLRDFQDALRKQQGKIRISKQLIQRYGLAPKVKLGTNPLLSVRDLATYLYDNTIHPRFFAEALHVIASKAKRLEPHLSSIQLRKLRRDNLATALGTGAIDQDDIGRSFQLFCQQPVSKKLYILQKLGVLVFQKEPKIAKPENPRVLEPRPPIKKIDPKQLDLLDKLDSKKS